MSFEHGPLPGQVIGDWTSQELPVAYLEDFAAQHLSSGPCSIEHGQPPSAKFLPEIPGSNVYYTQVGYDAEEAAELPEGLPAHRTNQLMTGYRLAAARKRLVRSIIQQVRAPPPEPPVTNRLSLSM